MFGPGGISIWQLLIILVIVVMIFGTKKLRGMGADLGSAVKGFKGAVKEEQDAAAEDSAKLESADDNPVERTNSSVSEDKA